MITERDELLAQVTSLTSLKVTHGQIFSQLPYKCYLEEEAFVWELTQETIVLPLGCLQGGVKFLAHTPL